MAPRNVSVPAVPLEDRLLRGRDPRLRSSAHDVARPGLERVAIHSYGTRMARRPAADEGRVELPLLGGAPPHSDVANEAVS